MVVIVVMEMAGTTARRPLTPDTTGFALLQFSDFPFQYGDMLALLARATK